MKQYKSSLSKLKICAKCGLISTTQIKPILIMKNNHIIETYLCNKCNKTQQFF
jgi:hypothetical protein